MIISNQGEDTILFDETTGISTVTILTKIGEFTGTSKLHDEDKNISSSFAGCQYAEMRAVIKYMKRKMHDLDMQIKGLTDFQSSLKCRKDYNHISIENSKARRRIYELNKQKEIWEKRMNSLYERMLRNMEQREKVIEKIINKGDKK